MHRNSLIRHILPLCVVAFSISSLASDTQDRTSLGQAYERMLKDPDIVLISMDKEELEQRAVKLIRSLKVEDINLLSEHHIPTLWDLLKIRILQGNQEKAIKIVMNILKIDQNQLVTLMKALKAKQSIIPQVDLAIANPKNVDMLKSISSTSLQFSTFLGQMKGCITAVASMQNIIL